MESHRTVSHDNWIEARKQLLAKEKEFTRLRDQLSQQRRDLPWERVEKPYVFDGPNGRETLADLFDGRQQLIVYHFMFDPIWDAGCQSCSFWADNFNGIVVHLQHRDVTLIAISRASHTPEELEKKEAYYNYTRQKPYASEAPGISVFYRDPAGAVFHTYSCYARGLDMLNGAYHFLDLVPKGRDEANLPSHSAWLRRHDEYPD